MGNGLGEYMGGGTKQRRGGDFRKNVLREACWEKGGGHLSGARCHSAAHHRHGCLLRQDYASKAGKGLRSNHHEPVLPPLGIISAHEQIT